MVCLNPNQKLLVTVIVSASLAACLSIAAILVFHPGSSGTPQWNGTWTGWGDWEACADIASVKPAEAIGIAMQDLGLSSHDMLSKTVSLGPVYVEADGDVFDLTCSGGITVGGERQPWQHPTVSQPSYAWEISFSEDWSLCMPSLAYVEWNVTQTAYHAHGC